MNPETDFHTKNEAVARLTAKAKTLQMDWCLECHRAPERFLRPLDQIYTLGWQPPGGQIAMGQQLVKDFGIKVDQLIDCSICHR